MYCEKTTPPPASLSFVCCIEHGRLEAQTVLMLRSLRRFGGALRHAPVMVVVGRRGAPLRASTRAALDELGAELCMADAGDNPAPWFNYANKVAAVALADRRATTSTIAWLDSDVIVAGEPAALQLGEGEDFAARCEVLPPAVHQGSRKNEAYWIALCGLLGTAYEALPWIDRGDGRPPQRMYFNSGVFAWRRGSAFAPAYAQAFRRLLSSRLAQADGSFFTADQVVLAPVVVREGLRWRHLGYRDHHMVFQGLLDGPMAAPPMGESALLHYSGSLKPPHRERFLSRLQAELPEVSAWLAEQESRAEPGPAAWPQTAWATSLRLARGLQWRLYARRAIPCPDTETASAVHEAVPQRSAHR